MAYAVATPVFEGPFDLLLHLILREEVDLYCVRLSDIVDGYLAYLHGLENLELEIATEFLLIAATLIELKVRRLLPEPAGVELDEELTLWEARDLLLARLLECKTFKDVATVLEERMEESARSVPRTAGPEAHFLDRQPNVLEGITPQRLREAFLTAIRPKPKPHVQLDHVTPIRASVLDAIELVFDQVRRRGRVSFRELCHGRTERIDVVVRFLAVLELFKAGRVDLDQPDRLAVLMVIWVPDDSEGTLWKAAELTAVDAYSG